MRLLTWLLLAGFGAAAADQPADWGPLERLRGEWVGEGGGGPGQGSGWFSFKTDLQGKILVRTNRAEYPASKERPAFAHDDLMIVYRDSTAAPAHAIYFDSEGHTIRYDVQPGENAIVFVSAAQTNAPRYRLTYTLVDRDHLKIRFEIAPPAHPDRFAPYIDAAARRR